MSLPKRIQNRVIYYTQLNAFRKKNRKRSNIEPGKTIGIFSGPRSGSTWLAELLNQIPDSSLAIEPLYKNKLKEFRHLNFNWLQPIPENEEWPEAERAFKKLLNIEITPLSVYYLNDLKKLPFSKHYIFKFCYANMLLPWLVKKFKLSSLLLVRHPCAVVSSQLTHGAWRGIQKDGINYPVGDFRYNEMYLQYSSILNSIKTVEERMAANWSFMMVYSAKNQMNNINWTTVAYESLVKNYEMEIERIFLGLSLAIPPKIWGHKKIPSATTKRNLDPRKYELNQLGSWKEQLSSSQINNILGIVKEFGITFYDRSLEPDYDQLYAKK